MTTLRPLMPPLPLTSSAANWAPSANCLPIWARLPVIGAATPMTMSWAAAGLAGSAIAARTCRIPKTRKRFMRASSHGAGSRTGEHGASLEQPPAHDDGPDGSRIGQAAQGIAGDEDEVGLGARCHAAQ